jgi:hypothetical protein
MVPAEGPADQVYVGAAVVQGDPAYGGREDVVDPVLEAHPAVGEGDVAVVDDVRRVTVVEQVARERLAGTQVVAVDRHGQRRDEQHGCSVDRGVRIVAAQGPVVTGVHGRRRGRVGLLYAVAEREGPRVAHGPPDSVTGSHR